MPPNFSIENPSTSSDTRFSIKLSAGARPSRAWDRGEGKAEPSEAYRPNAGAPIKFVNSLKSSVYTNLFSSVSSNTSAYQGLSDVASRGG